MTVRSSRLATDLEAAAAAATDPFEAACLRADLAAQWARLGRIEEAEALLSTLREQFSKSPHRRLTPWLNFAESMVDLRRHRLPEALLKMRRAHALAVATDIKPLAALAASKLAHMYWNAQEVDMAVRLVSEALRTVTPDDNRSLCGAALLLGEMLALSGKFDAGKIWFVKCRQYASVVGDTASQSALNFNLSLIALAILTQKKFQSSLEPVDDELARKQWAASSTLDEVFAILPPRRRSLLQSAQLHSICDEPELALSSYADLELANLAPGDRRRALWQADQAWCQMRLGNTTAALEKASYALQNMGHVSHLDDLATSHSMLALVFQGADDEVMYKHHLTQASEYWRRYRVFQAHTASLCLNIQYAP